LLNWVDLLDKLCLLSSGSPVNQIATSGWMNLMHAGMNTCASHGMYAWSALAGSEELLMIIGNNASCSDMLRRCSSISWWLHALGICVDASSSPNGLLKEKFVSGLLSLLDIGMDTESFGPCELNVPTRRLIALPTSLAISSSRDLCLWTASVGWMDVLSKDTSTGASEALLERNTISGNLSLLATSMSTVSSGDLRMLGGHDRSLDVLRTGMHD
jgi:hypothetical protein